MTTPSRIVTPERRADDVADATRPPLDVTARLRRLVAIAGASRIAGEGAETAQPIKLGLKELAK
jgi:hypothetical protein